MMMVSCVTPRTDISLMKILLFTPSCLKLTIKEEEIINFLLINGHWWLCSENYALLIDLMNANRHLQQNYFFRN